MTITQNREKLTCQHNKSYEYYDNFYNLMLWECPQCGAREWVK